MRLILPWLATTSILLVGCREHEVTKEVPPSPSPATAGESEGDGSEGEVDDGEGDDLPPPPAPPVAPSGQPAHVLFLDEVRRVMSAAKTTRYSHVFVIDETAGTFQLDCSGFVDYALSRSAPAALAALPRSPPKHMRPRAEDYVKAFRSGASSWRSVARASDLQPGDVVAWLRPADSTSKNTGHVMVVNAAPRALGANEWAVPIADSTALRHGASDSRTPTKATGLGSGTIVLLVDGAGIPTSFRWSPQTKRAHTTAIALGRLAP
jgi:hypothetical protein